MGQREKLRPLSPIPARADLTDREFADILGGLIGGLLHRGDLDDLRNAVRWWAEKDECWEALQAQKWAVQRAASNKGAN